MLLSKENFGWEYKGGFTTIKCPTCGFVDALPKKIKQAGSARFIDKTTETVLAISEGEEKGYILPLFADELFPEWEEYDYIGYCSHACKFSYHQTINAAGFRESLPLHLRTLQDYIRRVTEVGYPNTLVYRGAHHQLCNITPDEKNVTLYYTLYNRFNTGGIRTEVMTTPWDRMQGLAGNTEHDYAKQVYTNDECLAIMAPWITRRYAQQDHPYAKFTLECGVGATPLVPEQPEPAAETTAPVRPSGLARAIDRATGQLSYEHSVQVPLSQRMDEAIASDTRMRMIDDAIAAQHMRRQFFIDHGASLTQPVIINAALDTIWPEEERDESNNLS